MRDSNDTLAVNQRPRRQYAMLNLDAQRTREKLPYNPLATALQAVLIAHREHRVNVPDRTRVALPHAGTLLVMLAADDKLAMVKLVTVHPGNSSRGLPTIQGQVIVCDANGGGVLGTLDGAVTSARRTAALSLLAARWLAPVKSGPLLVIGAGAQARAHLEAFHEGLDVGEVYIHSRTRERAQELAMHASSLGMVASVVDDTRKALKRARLVVTATTSRSPVLPGRLSTDTFVAAIGAFTPDMRELPVELIARSNVIVDTLEGARTEAGGLIQAAAVGAFHWESAHTLDAVIDGKLPRLDGPVVFKSVGHSLWDLAAAHLAFATP